MRRHPLNDGDTQLRSGENLYVREIKSGALTPGEAGVVPAARGSKSSHLNFNSANDFTGRTRWVYQELRDRKVALFIDHLPEGVWQLSYENAC